AAQIIVAADLTQSSTDSKQLLPMLAQVAMHLEQKPQIASADAGYFSEANINDAAVTGIDLYVATGRDQHGAPAETATGDGPAGATPRERMRHKLRTEAGRAVYKMRKAIVEPVFGQIKERRGFRRFSLRGKQNVGGEWRLVCAVSNLLKLFRSGWTPETA
ncbi:MAG: transposase, partial [Terracidiphilus sp.]